MSRPTWICEECGCLFVLTLEKHIRCALEGDGHHCHVGDEQVDQCGRIVRTVADPACLPYSTTG